MIHAKPLKRKDLGRVSRHRTLTDSSEQPVCTPSATSLQIVNNSTAESKPVSKVTVELNNQGFINPMGLLTTIVKLNPALTVTQVYNIAQAYYSKYTNRTLEYHTVVYYLRKLVKQDVLTKIKVDDIYRYFLRVK
mgnify:CR=1 FL=1